MSCLLGAPGGQGGIMGCWLWLMIAGATSQQLRSCSTSAWCIVCALYVLYADVHQAVSLCLPAMSHLAHLTSCVLVVRSVQLQRSTFWAPLLQTCPLKGCRGSCLTLP